MKYYLIRALDKLNLLRFFNFNISIRINDKKLMVPIINGMGQQNFYHYEKWLGPFLKKLLSKTEGGFVDVGVNIGQTLLKVAAVDTSIPYIGFEPNPFAFCYAYRLIEKNKLANHHLYYTGLFSEEKILTLHMDNYVASGASVLPNFRENMSKYKRHLNVPVFKGDSIFSSIDFKAGCMKIDVEGAELEVLKGSKNFLEKNRPAIILEILPVYSLEKENGQYRKKREGELIEFLHNMGYTMYRINEATISLTQMNDIPVHNKMSLTNYLFLPSEKAETFTKLFE